jgi:hypothetical protein
MGWRGFGFVHHSRTLFCRAVPNPNLTIRDFFHRGTPAASASPAQPASLLLPSSTGGVSSYSTRPPLGSAPNTGSCAKHTPNPA